MTDFAHIGLELEDHVHRVRDLLYAANDLLEGASDDPRENAVGRLVSEALKSASIAAEYYSDSPPALKAVS